MLKAPVKAEGDGVYADGIKTLSGTFAESFLIYMIHEQF